MFPIFDDVDLRYIKHPLMVYFNHTLFPTGLQVRHTPLAIKHSSKSCISCDVELTLCNMHS